MPSKSVLSVGQCGADHASIAGVLRRHFDCAVTGADALDDALGKLRADTYALVLVNRVLDIDGTSGLDVISAIKSDAALRELPIMLVSNYADAQEQAAQLGAATGFGKATLGHSATIARLRPFLG